MAISEALSCGLPVIASSVGAIPEQIKGFNRGKTNDNLNPHSIDRANGLLFEKKDEKSLFEKIMWMYNNKDQMSLLSYNARYFAKMELDMNNRISQFINYYDSL